MRNEGVMTTDVRGKRGFAELLADRKGQLDQPHYEAQVQAIVAAMVRAFRDGNKVLWFGNGASCASVPVCHRKRSR